MKLILRQAPDVRAPIFTAFFDGSFFRFYNGLEGTAKTMHHTSISWRLGACLVLLLSLALPLGSCGKTETEATFAELTQNYDVIIMKHCYPSSGVLPDTGSADPASSRQSLENYKAVYRLLRDKFDANPDTLFILWTLPPLHRLVEPSQGDKDSNAARATEFSTWMQTDFLTEGGEHPNIRIFDFRGLVVDPADNFLKYEYERSHDGSDSHPDDAANNDAGPKFAQFIADAGAAFFGSQTAAEGVDVIFLHHSTGQNVYEYPDKGVEGWMRDYNQANGTNIRLTDLWYPADDNMPVDYYRAWLAK